MAEHTPLRFIGQGFSKAVTPVFESVGEMLRHAAARRTFEGYIGEIEQELQALLVEANDSASDRVAEYASHILKLIRITREKIAEGKADQAARWAIKIGIFLREFDLKLEWERTALKGRSFEEGPKKKRRDNLSKLIDEGLLQLGKGAGADAVLGYIKLQAELPGSLVQEIEEDSTIWWKDRRGQERKTKFHTFENRVGKRRKMLFPS